MARSTPVRTCRQTGKTFSTGGVVDGTVNARQDMPPDAQVLVHSAPLSSGNSGGPLVDFCGRVLGVNTCVRQGPMRTLNFAVATATLALCLKGTAAAVTVQTSNCAPNVKPLPEAVPETGPETGPFADTTTPQAGKDAMPTPALADVPDAAPAPAPSTAHDPAKTAP